MMPHGDLGWLSQMIDGMVMTRRLATDAAENMSSITYTPKMYINFSPFPRPLLDSGQSVCYKPAVYLGSFTRETIARCRSFACHSCLF